MILFYTAWLLWGCAAVITTSMSVCAASLIWHACGEYKLTSQCIGKTKRDRINVETKAIQAQEQRISAEIHAALKELGA